MTERFVSAAEMMCRVLGMPDYRFAVIGHPVSSATDADLKAMARAAIDQGSAPVVEALNPSCFLWNFSRRRAFHLL